MKRKTILYLLIVGILFSSCAKTVPKEEQTKEEIKVEVEESEEDEKNLSETEKLLQEYLTLSFLYDKHSEFLLSFLC